MVFDKCGIFPRTFISIVYHRGHSITAHPGPRGGVELYSFSISALEGGGWSAPLPGRFIPGKDLVPIVQEAGWAPGPVWMCAKNLDDPTGIRSPDHPFSRYTDWATWPLQSCILVINKYFMAFFFIHEQTSSNRTCDLIKIISHK
jgi:hypothetical protein